MAAPWALNVVEGEDVDIGRLCAGSDLVGLEGVECFVDVVGETVALGAVVELEVVSLCWVCIRVLTTSSGVVITPAIPPALAAVAISNGSPIMLDPW